MLSSALPAAGEIGPPFRVATSRPRRDRLFYCAIVCVFATLLLDQGGSLALTFILRERLCDRRG